MRSTAPFSERLAAVLYSQRDQSDDASAHEQTQDFVAETSARGLAHGLAHEHKHNLRFNLNGRS